MPAELWHARVLVDLADEVLAGRVGGVRLAGEDQLHWAIRIVEQPRQSLRITEDQCRALIGGEAPGEAERQRVGIEQRSVSRIASGPSPSRRAGAPAACAHRPADPL